MSSLQSVFEHMKTCTDPACASNLMESINQILNTQSEEILTSA